MNLYKEVDFLKEPVVFVGVHALQWHDHPDQPTIGFAEVELEDIQEFKALKERVAELETVLQSLSDWECSNCGRTNPGTMKQCPCKDEE